MKKPGEWTREKIKTLKDKGVDLSYRAMYRHGYGAVVSMGNFYTAVGGKLSQEPVLITAE